MPDPYQTTRLPVTPTGDPRFADTAPRSPADPSATPPDRPGGTRIGAALFFDDRLADPQTTTSPHDAEDAHGRMLVDDAPTEAMAVVEAGWSAPRRTGRGRRPGW